MTNTCWELYSDFKLTSLLSTGRFDFKDLINNENTYSIAESKLSGEWDFDSIVLTHKCPYCKHLAYNTKSVLYLPHAKCDNCGLGPDFTQARNVIVELIRRFKYKQEYIVTYEKNNCSDIQAFVDPLVNSVIYWWLSEVGFVNLSAINSDIPADFNVYLRQIFNNSLFKLLTVSGIQKYFKKYLNDIDEKKWGFLITEISILGDLLNGNRLTEETNLMTAEASISIKHELPKLINNIILKNNTKEHGNA